MNRLPEARRAARPTTHGRVFLRQWLTANAPELRTALRPVGGAIAGVRGVMGAEATDDLLVEVTRIALDRAYVRYDLRYPSPRLWLLRIAHLVCRRWREEANTSRRRDGRMPGVSGDDPDRQEPALDRAAGPDGDDPARAVIDRIWLRHRLEGLSAEDRGVVQCRVVEGLPYEEAARRLGISEGAARVRYSRAVRRLRTQEEEESEYHVGRPVTGTGPRGTGGGQSEEAHE